MEVQSETPPSSNAEGSYLKGRLVREAVQLAPVVASEVKLGNDLWRVNEEENERRLEAYLPTETGRRTLRDILRGTSDATRKRVHLLTGSYGTGKSYLLLVLANLLAHPPGDERLQALRARIADGEPYYEDGLKEEIERARQGNDGYLVVIPDYADTDFRRAMLQALRRALDGEGIDYRPKTESRQAREVLDTWEDEHPDLLRKLKSVLEKHDTALPRLRARLEEHDPRALDDFTEYVEAVTSTPFSFERVKVEDTFSDVVGHLRREHDMKGIAVLFDEFGQFLSDVVNHPDGARGLAVQDFIEFVKREHRKQILFVMAAHRSLADYASASATQDDIEKIEGRFQQKHRLRISTRHNEAEQMMGGTFVTAPTDDAEALLDEARRHLDDLFFEEDWAGFTDPWYPSKDSAWVREEVVEGVYPLHPVVVRALPQLSERAGQSERTMFRFLSRGEGPGSAAAFLETAAMLETGPLHKEEGRVHLLHLDRLYDYFVEPIDARGATLSEAEPARLKNLYEDAKAKLRMEDDAELARRVLKAVVVIELARDEALQADPETIRWALNLPAARQEELGGLLHELARQDALRKNQHTGLYSFRRHGKSIEHVMAKCREQLAPMSGPDRVAAFRRARSLDDDVHDPYEYNDERETNRRVCFDYLVPDAVEQAVRTWTDYFENIYEKGNNRPYKGNVVVLYGLTESEGGRQKLLDARERFPEKWRPYLVFAIADALQDLSSRALDAEAARRMASDEEIKGNETAEEEALEQAVEYQERLAEGLDRALKPENFSWHRCGEERFAANELSDEERRTFLDRLVADLFPKTPVIENDTVQYYEKGQVNGHNKRRRYDVIDDFVSGHPFGFGGTSHEDEMRKGLLRPNDMFAKSGVSSNRDQGYVTPPPEGVSAHAAWEELERLLCDEQQTNSPLREAKHTLYQKPYGMSYPAVELFVGAFIGCHADDFTLNHRGSLIALSGKSIADAIHEPGKYALRYQSLLPGERTYLNELGVLFGERLEDEVKRAGPWEDAARKGQAWREALPAVTRAFAPKEHEQAGALIKVFSEASGEPAQTLIKETLPARMGFDGRDFEDKLFREDVLKAVEAGLDFCDQFTDEFAEDVLRDAAFHAFDETFSGLRDVRRAVGAWWDESVTPAARQHSFGSPADAFLDHVGREGRSVVDQLLRKLPHAWDLPPFEEWTQKQERQGYINCFKESVREVGSWKASPLPPLNRLLEESFERKPVETAGDFAEAVEAWHEALPEATAEALRRGDFSDEARALRDAIMQDGAVEDRFLKRLPQRLDIAGGGWPNWNQVAENNLVYSVAEAVEEVEAWRPPWTDEQVLSELGERFWREPPASPEMFDERARRWHAGLSPAARRHDFDGLAGTLMRVLEEEDPVSEAVRERLPRAANLLPLAEMREAASGEMLVKRLMQAYETVEAWQRPLRDVWAAPYARLGWNDEGPLGEASQFAVRLKHWRGALEHARYVRPERFDDHPAARALVAWADSPKADRAALFEHFARVADDDLPHDWRSWTREEDERFANALAEAKRHVETWEPPEQDARERLAQTLREVQEEQHLSTDDILTLLRELLDMWSQDTSR